MALPINVHLLGGRKQVVFLDSHSQQAADLFEAAATALLVPEAELKLVAGGKVLDRTEVLQLKEGEVVLAFRNSKPQARSRHTPAEPSEPLLSHSQQKFADLLESKVHLPKGVAELLATVKPSVYIGLVVWAVGAKFFASVGFGALYVLASMVLLIFCNLGQRKAGEASAYSIFNNFRELPGQLNAGVLDGQIRRGQM